MLPCFVSLVVQVPVFFLQIELDPVVKTDDFCPRFGFSNKDMLKSRGVQAGECFSLEIPRKIKCALIVLCTHIDLLMNVTNGQVSVSFTDGCFGVSPHVSLSVVEIEPDQP